MAHKKTRIARIAADLDEIPIEEITYRVLALVGCVMMISLSILGAIDLLVRVLRVMRLRDDRRQKSVETSSCRA
jgi:hypothetical protein